ncbi:hypothetical protein HPB52_007375 [Rhipicephalus sanguineus]|uniref:Tc1-like transposase DDE domain-containing protein n=1 Tax=Rhipicephalus sanguineus TaxID=34632 RepID=A0A9D4SMJ9_RHISA|nr:hypothetical protein HPB52_007375 [Rhipicephalus sanguineus]
MTGAQCVMVLDWPPQGADMNIIESVWAEMKKALSWQPLHKCSSEILWAAVEEEWQKLAPCVPHRQSAQNESVVCSRRDISGVHRQACSVGMRKRTGLTAPRWQCARGELQADTLTTILALASLRLSNMIGLSSGASLLFVLPGSESEPGFCHLLHTNCLSPPDITSEELRSPEITVLWEATS